jgi:ankyrin repeat protein
VLTVKQIIEDGEDLNCRDQVGRTPLHVAILSDSVEVGCALIDAGARMTARLVGGRTCLHLAAQMGQATVVTKLLERSAYNKEEKRKTEEAASANNTEGVRMSSEDDWSSEESDDEKPHRKPPAYLKKDEPEKDSDPLEDNEDEPDILDISIHDWDFGLTALGYGILSGSLEVVDALLVAGADPSFVAHAKNVNPLHPLALTIYTQDEEHAAKIAERLVAAQAISSTADDILFTIFHRIVLAGKTKIVASLLEHDPNAKKVLNSPAWYTDGLVFPVVSAIEAGDYATLSVLLAHGAKLSYLPEDISRAEEKRYAEHPCLWNSRTLTDRDSEQDKLPSPGTGTSIAYQSANRSGPWPMRRIYFAARCSRCGGRRIDQVIQQHLYLEASHDPASMDFQNHITLTVQYCSQTHTSAR